jgi:hypothetical protein
MNDICVGKTHRVVYGLAARGALSALAYCDILDLIG